MTPEQLSCLIKERACRIGFDACGIARAVPTEQEAAQLDTWIEKGYHAGMEWLREHRPLRCGVSELVPQARSVIVCLLRYARSNVDTNDVPFKIARYAWGRDYHPVIRSMLEELLSQIRELSPGTEINGRCFIDSAPLFERRYAVEAGMGWIGRNSLLIHPELGSFVLIGEIVIDLPLAYDQPYPANGCGNCRRCIEGCPTGAVTQDPSSYTGTRLDCRRCLAYLTIEHKGEFSASERELIRTRGDGRIFGCDACQEVCPWNRKALARIAGPADRKTESLLGTAGLIVSMRGKSPGQVEQDWKLLTKSQFNRLYRPTPLFRAGLSSLLRNMAVYNQGE